MVRRKIGRKLTERQFYCVKCKRVKSRPVDDICFLDLSSQIHRCIPALSGECPTCGTYLYKFVSHAKAGRLRKKYGYCRGSKPIKNCSRRRR